VTFNTAFYVLLFYYRSLHGKQSSCVYIFGRPLVKRSALCYRPLSCLSVLFCLSVCDVGVLWPSSWTDQCETWHAVTPRPWPNCVGWGPSSPPPKGHSPSNFRVYLLRPNRCMDQDATWYGGRPRPRRLCVRWRPVPPLQKGGGAPNYRHMFIVAKRLVGSRWHLA